MQWYIQEQRVQMQVISLLSFILFVFFYAKDNIAYITAAAVFFAVLIAILYLYYIRTKVLPLSPPFLLAAIFLLMAFYQIGSTNVPQTYMKLTKQSPTADFVFDQPQSISRICYYVGIDKNAKFVIEYQNKSEKWKPFYKYRSNYPFSFQWRCLTAGIKSKHIRLTLLHNKMMLGEVYFFHGKDAVPYSSPNRHLYDEQASPVDTTYRSSMYFDEIYHGRTAYEIMHGLSVYENVHPYLGKMLLIPGIKLFGMTPFGWRFMNVLFAAFMIICIYYMALQLFKKEIFAFAAAWMLTFSFMHFTQARLAHIDTFGVFFVICSYYFLYRFITDYRVSMLFVSGIFFGLAASVKWSAVFASLGYGGILIYLMLHNDAILKRYPLYKLLLYGLYSYLMIAGSVYLLSFWDILVHGNGLKGVIDYNLNMYHYHTTLKATHPYSSPWWSWLLDLKPMGYYRQMHGSMLSTINAFGNPAIVWTGLISIAFGLYFILRYSSKEGALVLFALLGLLLSYAFVGRLMFIYHLYYALPFVILSVVFFFKEGVCKREFCFYAVYLYLILVAGLFLLFYPVLSGYEIDKGYVVHWLKWFKGWWL